MIKNFKVFLGVHKQAVVASIIISLIFNLPTLLGYVIEMEGRHFSGQNSWFDPWDMNVYFSAIRWSQENGLSFRNVFSTTDSNAPILYPLYTIVGFVVKNIDAALIYAVLNFTTGVVLALSIYFSAFLLTRNNGVSLKTQVLTSFAGGFGWLVGNSIASPDLHITPFTFVSAYQKAHEAVALSLMLFTYSLLFTMTKKVHAVLLIFFLSLTCVFYPFYIISVPLVAFVYPFVTKNLVYLKNIFIILLICVPLVGLYSINLSNNQSLAGVVNQRFDVVYPAQIILGYGPLLIFSTSIIVKRKTNSADRLDKFLLTWFIINIIISFIPSGIGKFYLRGLFFPLSLFVISNLSSLKSIFLLSYRYVFQIILIFSSMTTLLITTVRLYNLFVPSNVWVYLPVAEYELIEYVAKLPQSNIMAPYPVSNIIPGLTNNGVFAGHPIQTPDFKEKITIQEEIITSQKDPLKARTILTKHNINYVVSTKPMEKYEFLEEIYSNETYHLYKN